MIALANASSDEDIRTLKKVLFKCKECDLVGSLKRFIKRPDDTYNEMMIKQDSFKAKFAVNINANDSWVYLDIMTRRKADVKLIRSLWETMIRRGTQNALKQTPNDYALAIDLIASELENNTVYILSFFQPIFISDEGNSANGTGMYLFRMLFPIESVFFGIEKVTPDEVEYAEMSDNTDVYNDDTSFDTDEEGSNIEESSKDFIDTSKYM